MSTQRYRSVSPSVYLQSMSVCKISRISAFLTFWAERDCLCFLILNVRVSKTSFVQSLSQIFPGNQYLVPTYPTGTIFFKTVLMIISSEKDTFVKFKSSQCDSKDYNMGENEVVQIRCANDFTGSEVWKYSKMTLYSSKINSNLSDIWSGIIVPHKSFGRFHLLKMG